MKQLWRYAVVGNIKKSRIDENGILRYGTAAFKGNTKVYISGKKIDERLPDRDKNEITVMGLCRGGRYYVERVPVDLIENVRLTRVYKPKVLELMSYWEFAHCWWGNTQEEFSDAYTFIKRWKETHKSN